MHCGANCCTSLIVALPLNCTHNYTSWTWSRTEKTEALGR